MKEAIRGNQRQSEAIRGNQRGNQHLDAQLVLGGSAPQVDLVAKDQEGNVIQVLAREQALLTHKRAVAAAR